MGMNFAPTLRSLFRRGKRSKPVARRHRPLAIETLEDRMLLAGFTANWTTIASDLHPTLRLFGSSNPSHAPFRELNFVAGTVTKLTDLPNIAASVDKPQDLKFRAGSANPSISANTPVLKLDASKFDSGVGDGVANQTYLPKTGTNNAVTVFNKGVAVAKGVIQRITINTNTSFESSGTGIVKLTRAVGTDPTVFNEIGTRTIKITFKKFNFQGTPIGFGDAAKFTSVGVAVIQPATTSAIGATAEAQNAGIAAASVDSTNKLTTQSASRQVTEPVLLNQSHSSDTSKSPSVAGLQGLSGESEMNNNSNRKTNADDTSVSARQIVFQQFGGSLPTELSSRDASFASVAAWH